MHSVSVALLLGLFSFASAAPFSINPSQTNGFPNITGNQLDLIEQAAHGSLPSPGASTPVFSADTLTSLRFIEFNENFEVAFFNSLIQNITNNVAGYSCKNDSEKKRLMNVLSTILAQEELHALNAGNALKGQKQDSIQPCQYQFPTTGIEDAIALASTFTDVVLSTLPDLQSGFANNKNDTGLIRAVGSVIGQEGEQNGFFRDFLRAGKNPSELPFLTAGTRRIAFSALQGFVVDGSCPNANLIDITPINYTLSVPASVKAKNTNIPISFTADSLTTVPADWKGSSGDYAPLSLVYVNQQNTPVVEKFQPTVTPVSGGLRFDFDAPFPFNGTTFGNGLTLAFITLGNVTLNNVVDVSDAAIAGPGLIVVN